MNTAEQILVITLASFLAIFLLTAIILILKIISLANKLNAVADTAKEVVNNVESAAETFKNAAGPLAVGKMLMNISNLVKKHKGGK